MSSSWFCPCISLSEPNSWRANLLMSIWGRICLVPPIASLSTEDPALSPPRRWPLRRRLLTSLNLPRRTWRNWRNERKRKRKGNKSVVDGLCQIWFGRFWLDVLSPVCFAKSVWLHLNTFVHQDIDLKKALVMKTLTIYMLVSWLHFTYIKQVIALTFNFCNVG